MKRFPFILACLLLASVGCFRQDGTLATITLATTTSTRDSGLLDVLVPMFQKETGIEVKVVAVGSGQALELGRRGDADVLLTHAPAAEKKFMDDGCGEDHRAVMHNDFVLVGPVGDPAQIKGEKSVAMAFTRIASAEALFVSRGDDSGTHMKEREIWRQTEIEPGGAFYIQAGAGMAAALRLADHKNAYTLSDRSTFLAQQKNLDLVILCETDPKLLNFYSVILVSRDRYPQVHYEAARRFADFLLSRKVQETIADFGVEEFGQPLFFANPDF